MCVFVRFFCLQDDSYVCSVEIGAAVSEIITARNTFSKETQHLLLYVKNFWLA